MKTVAGKHENRILLEGYFMKKEVRQGILICLAFIGVYGFGYLLKVMNVSRGHYTIIHLFIFITLIFALSWTRAELEKIEDKRQKRRRIGYSFLTGLLFSLSMIMGYQLQNRGLTDGGLYGKGMILFHSACLSVAFFPFIQFALKGMERLKNWTSVITEREKPDAKKIFIISSIVIFVCLIPVWLAYYPIIMSYDFHRQVNEAAKGFAWFYPYQPIAHTWIIWVFLQLGKALGSLEAGMAGMALFQILLYSLACGYACTFIYRTVKKVWPVVLGVLFFGLFPLNTVVILCTTKDVIFSILFLVFFLLLCERTFYAAGRKKWILDGLLVLEGCLMMQFRNNAWYAVAVFVVFFLLFTPGKERLRVLLLCVLLLAGSKGMQAGIKAAIGTELKVPKGEMFGVPMQQYARVGYQHGPVLDMETKQLVETYVNEEAWEYYNPPICDSVKFNTTADGFNNDISTIILDWLKVGIKYPNEFLDAFLELTRGYWFWDDVSWAEALGSGLEGRMGAVYTYNSSEIENVGPIEHVSKFPWLEMQLEKIVSANIFYEWPLFSVLFKSATYSWGLILTAVMFLYLRQKKQMMLCMLPLSYFATMLLGPMVCIRYLTPVILVLPVLFVLVFSRKKEE